MKRSIDTFMPLNGEKEGASEELRERGRLAMELYIQQKYGRPEIILEPCN